MVTHVDDVGDDADDEGDTYKGPKWSLYAGPWWQLVTMMTLTIVGSRRGGPVTDMRVSSGHSIQHSIHLNQDLEKEKVLALIKFYKH